MDVRALVAVPVAGAVLAALDPRTGRRQAWLLAAALLHAALVALAWAGRLPAARLLWLGFDPLGGIVLSLVSLVFVAVAVYSVGYFRSHDAPGARSFEACLLAFLSCATVLCLTDHFGVLWVAMEATTLATAPLLYDPRDRHSIEAVWKYLVLCSVGIAVALLGTFMLALSAGGNASAPGLVRTALVHAGALHPTWFRAAFVFLLVGYGTKAGLAPMHTWLPDAHGEAPSPISALLSGALLSCALLALLRVLQVAHAGGQDAIVAPVLLATGLLSMLVAAALLIRQRGYKRMLAYSSIEHMGVVLAGLGLGGAAVFGALLHMLAAALAKALLFFAAGNALLEYGTKRIDGVRGMARRLPWSGALLVLGFFALSGAPPFGSFVSEVTIVRGAVAGGRLGVAAVFLLLQAIAFIALATRIVSMAHGAADTAASAGPRRESAWLVLPPVALLGLVLLLGVALGGPLQQALSAAAATLGGGTP